MSTETASSATALIPTERPFVPNPETLEAMDEIERGGLRKFASIEELFEDLHADD